MRREAHEITKAIAALHKARKYIMVAKSWRKIEPECQTVAGFDNVIETFSGGDEIEAIDEALLVLELGAI